MPHLCRSALSTLSLSLSRTLSLTATSSHNINELWPPVLYAEHFLRVRVFRRLCEVRTRPKLCWCRFATRETRFSKDLSLFRDRAIIAAFSFFHSLKFVSTRESVFSNTTALSGESRQFVFNDPHRRIKLALSSAVESRNRSLSRYIITIHANDCVFNVE